MIVGGTIMLTEAEMVIENIRSCRVSLALMFDLTNAILPPKGSIIHAYKSDTHAQLTRGTSKREPSGGFGILDTQYLTFNIPYKALCFSVLLTKAESSTS